jgi:uncharacterized protein (DUF342 family)
MENIIYSPSGNVSIRINGDKMSAWMYIHKSDTIIDEKEILGLIQDAGICYGFEEALEWMSANGYNKDFEKPFPVAICKSALSKEKVTVLFDRENSFDPEAEWNLKEMSNWASVDQGTPLAEISYNLFTNGGSVYNIFGELTTELVSATFLSDFMGNNVSLDNDNRRILADVAGYPYFDKDGKINVAGELVYRGDIKFIKLPLTLAASLVVEGSVQKAYLSVQKNLTVRGNINAAEVYTEGNLIVEGSIVDCQTAGVVALKDIRVKSIANSLVLCLGNLSFETTIANSRIIAEKAVLGDPDLSMIKGSQVLSSGCIDIADAGDEEGNEAELEITMSPFKKERISQMNKVLNSLKEDPENNAAKIELANHRLKNLEKELADEINAILNKPTESKRFIKIRNELFKNVYIRVMKKSFPIKLDQSNVEFSDEDILV